MLVGLRSAAGSPLTKFGMLIMLVMLVHMLIRLVMLNSVRLSPVENVLSYTIVRPPMTGPCLAA